MKITSFESQMLRLEQLTGSGRIFSDFLELVVSALQLGAAEEHYLQVIRRYEKPYASMFAQALAALVNEMTGDGSGLVDVLGEYFMNNVTRGLNGQYFTPQPVCDMMAGMIRSGGTGRRVADPTCGSGRMLLAAAKFDRSLRFYGADISRECAQMAAINLCLNGLFGEIAWMDTLSNKFYGGWKIDLHPQGAPYLRAISEDESEMVLRLPESKPEPARTQQLVFHF